MPLSINSGPHSAPKLLRPGCPIVGSRSFPPWYSWLGMSVLYSPLSVRITASLSPSRRSQPMGNMAPRAVGAPGSDLVFWPSPSLRRRRSVTSPPAIWEDQRAAQVPVGAQHAVLVGDEDPCRFPIGEQIGRGVPDIGDERLGIVERVAQHLAPSGRRRHTALARASSGRGLDSSSSQV